MRVDIEEIIKIRNRITEINQIPLKELEIYQNGIKLNIDLDLIEDFNLLV